MNKKNLPKRKHANPFEELKSLMDENNYINLRYFIKDNPNIIHEHNSDCEVPLVMAIRRWDAKLVKFFIEAGADPHVVHKCPNHPMAKIPVAILAEELLVRIKNDKDPDSITVNILIYEDIMAEMVHKISFAQGAG